MFTGLIQKLGTVKRVSRGAGLVVEIAFEPWPSELEDGESIAVNGVCLTVAHHDRTRFTADVLRETESRSTLGWLTPGMRVNLERALRSGEAFGGHIVQGHVDATGSISAKIPRGRDFRLKINAGRVFVSQCVLKGSVAIDGVSLTISDIGEDWFTVDLIPTTAQETILGARKPGDKVNLESDVLGKYARRAVSPQQPARGGLSEEALARAGFIL